MQQYLLNFPDWQKDTIRELSQVTGYSMAEVMRRLLDNSLRNDFLWEVFPIASGRVAAKHFR